MIDLVLYWEGAGADTYSRRFRTAASIEDFSPALRKIAIEGIAPSIVRNFEEGGRPKWAPLSDETVLSKMRKGFFSPRTILVASGELMESASDPTEYTITRTAIIAQPGPFYWRYHQIGAPPKLPQRVIMNLQIADQRRIGGIFDRFIAEHLAKNGLKVRGQHTVIVGGATSG